MRITRNMAIFSLLVIAAVAAHAADPVVREYSVPKGSHPYGSAPATDGGVWNTVQHGVFAQMDRPKTTDQVGARVVLEDFSQYPQGWRAREGFSKANEVYQLVRVGNEVYLHAQGGSEPVRIFKKISWDSNAFPIIQWKWRVKQWPPDPEAQVYLYISLDRDVFGVPTITRYVWSRQFAEGLIIEGGYFSPTDVVVRSGYTVSDDWITEKINALSDFQRITGRDPGGAAFGIGILVDPGVVVEIGEIVALRE
jgi:hypothetical protein